MWRLCKYTKLIPHLASFFPFSLFPYRYFKHRYFSLFHFQFICAIRIRFHLTPHLFWSNNGNFIFRFRRKSTECWHSVFAYFHFWKFKRSILTQCSNALLISQKGSDFLPQTELIFYAVRRTQWRTAATWW